MNIPPQTLSPDTDAPAQDSHGHSAKNFRLLLIGCIGVVYGDIGTSPLYAFREAASHLGGGKINPAEILGILSLIVWAMTIIVTVKYVLFLLRTDNRGEGGILSLMALAQRGASKKAGIVFLAGISGAALFFGEAAITPAISVLSAMEGLHLITPALDKYVLPFTILILVILFSVQRHGTGHMARFFGPITVFWFLVLGGIGLYWIVRNPIVLLAFSPHYAVEFLFSHGFLSFVVLGSVFLAVTGAEALYADLGHFGRKPIQYAWLFLVFPCLALNYLGQGAMLIKAGTPIPNTFFMMFPEWALIPVVALATMATIIASQAVITGAFSVARQAMQLGLLPRLEVRHTSESHEGQIYMPKINMMLMWTVLLLCLIFQSSTNLAAAYGISITATMMLSSILIFFMIAKIWKKGYLLAGLITIPFFLVETVFFSSNLLKLFDGGFVPLLLGVYIVLMVITWVNGTRYVTIKAARQSISMIDLAEMLERDPPVIVPGTAIFLTSDQSVAPETMMQNLKHNQVLHEKNIILTISVCPIPRVPIEQRIEVESINSHMMRVIVSFGFMETPNVPAALYRAKSLGYDIDVEHASFFLGHRKFIADPHHGLPLWQDSIYIAMAKSAVDATDYFRIPPSQAVEIGTRQIV